MRKLTAVIVKGNPFFIENNTLADDFYEEIKMFLEQLGYEVSFDRGMPYTQPKHADLWIGHSRGGDRLRFSSEDTETLIFGSPHKGAINHPEDNSIMYQPNSDMTPNNFHYKFTNEMKESIVDATQRIQNQC